MRKKTILVILTLLSLGSAVAWAGQQSVPMAISFGAPIADEVVIALLRAYDARPHAVYMFAAGLSGAHRVSPQDASVDAIEVARESTIRGVEGTLQESDGGQFREILEKAKSLKGFEASPELQTLAESRLLLREQHLALLRVAQENAPLVYALEVVVNAADAPKLAAHPLVKKASIGVWVKGRSVGLNRPRNFSEKYHSPRLEGMSPAMLYQEVKRLATPDREEAPRAF